MPTVARRSGFDAGPLSWVKHEIDSALARAVAALEAPAADGSSFKAARGHLHQAHGALQIVGLPGITRVTQELEGLLGDLEKDPARADDAALEAARRGFRDVAAYLEGLMAGKASVPLQLLDALQAMLSARGASGDPVELYFPDLGQRPPPRDRAPVVLHPEETKDYLREQRARYQKGLLAFLRNDRSGAAEMRAAVVAIEGAQSAPGQRAFWWIALAFFDALTHDALPPGDAEAMAAKRLCNRVEQQIRALSEGAPNVAERLMREALYFVARCTPASEHLHAVQQTYRLAGTLPAPEAGQSADATKQAVLDAARASHERAREAWDRFATGNTDALAAFREAAHAFAAACAGVDQQALSDLAAALERVAEWLATDASRANEALNVEQATALLLAGTVLQDPAAFGADFDAQSKLVCARLEECIEGRLLRTTIDIPVLDAISRRAQEKLITEQALADMKGELRSVEQVLDRFFRQPGSSAELAALAGPLERLDRSLELIGESRARDALAQSAAQIRRFSASDFVAAGADFREACEKIAATVSGLAVHLEALSRGPADFDESMRPVGSSPAEPASEAEPSVEAKLAGVYREAQKLAAAWTRHPEDASLKGELQANLASIQQDAVLIADAGLQAAAADALRALQDPAAGPAQAEVARTLASLAPAVEPPAPSAAAERVAETAPPESADADAAVDRELLAVYLEEAAEVLAAARVALDQLRADPSGQEPLVGIRRGFHTLKGSGRMVGLARLGEAAWAVEQTLNLWLQEGRAVDARLIGFTGDALTYFDASVVAMSAGGTALDESPLIARAEAVRKGEAQPPAAVPDSPPAQTPALPSQPRAATSESVSDAPENFVDVGSQRVSATLFTLFSGEAHARLDALKTEHETLKIHGVVTDDMLRAAHTLASIAGTVQMHALHGLGRALERALERLALEPVSEEEAKLVDDAIESIERMVDQAVNCIEPTPEVEVLERLRQLVGSAPMAEETGGATVPDDEGAQNRDDGSSPAAPAATVAAKPARASGKDGLDDQALEDEIDPQLLPLFVEEGTELMPAILGALRAWREAPGEAARAQSLKRLLHTLKGSARMAGAMEIGELAHGMESRIEQGAQGGAATGKLLDELDGSFERIESLFQRLGEEGEPRTASAGDAAADAAAPAASESSPLLRVRAALVDRLVNEAGEVAIARGRIEGEMRSLRAALRELTDNVARLRSQLREIEIQAETQMQSGREQSAERSDFDPLEFDRFTRFQELTRMMAESVNDVHTVQQNLLHAMETTDTALAAQARLNRSLQQDLMRVRMVPVASLADRLHRIVRQAAKELGKRASLDLRGAQVELDRSVLERITAPIEHLLRNAVAHGIESPDERARAGKPPVGDVRLEVSQEGNEVVLVLSDDGAGLDLERVLARARELGIPAAAGQPAPGEIADFIFMPGFSTAAEVSELAGRGIGMDVVRNEVAGLGGRVELSFERGRGSRFAVHLPLTLAVTQAVLVRCAARTHAVPTMMVEHVMKLQAPESPGEPALETLEWQGRRYPLHSLAGLLGATGAEALASGPALFVRSGASSVAVRVDEILSSSQEVVVKAIGPHIARIPGISGATALGSGEIVLILNPVQLVERGAPVVVAAPPEETAPVPPLVMVVDDSLTVRKITGRLLERQGYRVATARDGVEALEMLEQEMPAALLVDVEMPRMDGYELVRHLRAAPALQHLPVLMITSRSAEKHQQLAFEVGVDAYLGKPFQEQELLAELERFIAGGRAAAAAR